MPNTAHQEVTATELQQSIFNAPPSALASLPAKVIPAPKTTEGDEGAPQGVKRRRDDESDDEGAPMEEGNSDASMEASSDEESS